MSQPDLKEELTNWLHTEKAIRDSVLKQLESKADKTKGQKIHEWLNESFTIWLLSSVLLGLITWGYTEWDENRAERERNQAFITRLDIEISSRLRKAVDRLEKARNQVGLRESIEMLDRGSGIFEEFEDRNLESLLLELVWLVPRDEKQDLDVTRESYHTLQQLRGSSVEEAKEVFEVRRSKLMDEYLNGYFSTRGWRGQ